MKIILFSDGTGNSSAKLFRTNVWRLYEGLDLGASTDQVAFYDNGVGTSSFKPLAVLGGAFGFGLKRNVLDIYKFLCRNYARDGKHEIYTFGFSRGAFTIRVLLGFIRRQGLVPYDGNEQELGRLATWAYRTYRAEAKPAWWLIRFLRYLRDRILRAVDGAPAYDRRRNIDELDVEFVGVWDTVSAYGLPIIELTRGWDLWVWPLSLPTRDLSAQVKKACHALSLDDERQTFHPLLWDEAREPTVRGATTIATERVSQVWFAGMHSNLGGGYPDDGMAYDSLVWIAGQSGLLLKPGVMDEWMERRTPTSPMADSRQGLGAYTYRYQPRSLAVLTHDAKADVHVNRPKIHESVFVRLQRRINDYAPIVLPEHYAVVGTDGTIHDLPSAATGIGQTPVAPETIDQARLRCHQQQTVWDLVWLRRVQYFVTVLVTCVLVALPFLQGTWQDHFLSWSLPTIGAWIAALAAVLPGWLSPWLDYFHRYPLQLAAGALLLVLLMGAGTAIERRIQDTMWAIWRRTWGGNPSRVLAGVRALRTAPPYQWLLSALRDAVVPNVFGFVMLVTIILGIVVTARRLTFDAEVLAGYVCGNAPARQAGSSGPQVFETKNLCQSTGFVLERGVTYEIELKTTSAWMDREHPVYGLDGFRSDKFVFYLAVPLRRHMRLNWFVPIARVGSLGDEYYPLTKEKTTITSRLGGQLFVYVNDALWFYPVDELYGNNSGQATIGVTRVTKGEGQ